MLILIFLISVLIAFMGKQILEVPTLQFGLLSLSNSVS